MTKYQGHIALSLSGVSAVIAGGSAQLKSLLPLTTKVAVAEDNWSSSEMKRWKVGIM